MYSTLVAVLCLFMTIAFAWKADASFRAKAVCVLLYVGSFLSPLVIHTRVPVGFLIQTALCIYYVIYFHYT